MFLSYSPLFPSSVLLSISNFSNSLSSLDHVQPFRYPMISDLSDDSILYVAMVSDKSLVIVQSSCGRLKVVHLPATATGTTTATALVLRAVAGCWHNHLYQPPRQIPESLSTVQLLHLLLTWFKIPFYQLPAKSWVIPQSTRLIACRLQDQIS
jgi:hypothetical protein